MYKLTSKEWRGLAKLSEEMGELQQVFGKLIDNGGNTMVKYDPKYCKTREDWIGLDLGAKLVEELADLSAALEYFIMNNFDSHDLEAICCRVAMKLEKYEEWSND